VNPPLERALITVARDEDTTLLRIERDDDFPAAAHRVGARLLQQGSELAQLGAELCLVERARECRQRPTASSAAMIEMTTSSSSSVKPFASL
jgi:hypothetical protein